MYWEEVIDRLTKEVGPNDFKVPFTDWWQIFKKIEEKSIVKENSNYYFPYSTSRIKAKKQIKEIARINFENELTSLSEKENYWINLTGKKPDSRTVVYDCKPYVLLRLFQLHRNDFYIVDKKYSWYVYDIIDVSMGIKSPPEAKKALQVVGLTETYEDIVSLKEKFESDEKKD